MINYDNEAIIRNKLEDLLHDINSALGDYVFSHVQLKRNTGTFVEPSSLFKRFDITVDMDNVELYADACNMSDLEAAKILITHEIMHVLLRHFKKEYRKLNHELFNLAADCEVNSYLDMSYPAIRAEQFDLPDFLDVKTYYTLLKRQSDQQKKEEEQLMKQFEILVSDFSQFSDEQSQGSNSSQSSDSQQNQNESVDTQANNNDADQDHKVMRNIDIEKNKKLTLDDLNNENEDNKNEDNETEDNDEVSEKMKKKVEKSICDDLLEKYSDDIAYDIDDTMNYFGIGTTHIQRVSTVVSKAMERALNKDHIEGLDEIIRKLTRKERTMEITPHSRKETYMKFNNRRKNGTIILPGKKLENSGVKKKFDTSLTVFIDMSGSTWDMNDTLINVAYHFYKLGATVVYYDTDILDMIKPQDRFRLMSCHGGTKIKDVLKQYLATGAKLERAYVITDGEDDFYELDQVVPKYNIYKITNKKIKEIYNDKNPCPHRSWYW